jgi:hypothetical protein
MKIELLQTCNTHKSIITRLRNCLDVRKMGEEKKPPYGREAGLPKSRDMPGDMPGTEPVGKPDQVPEEKRRKPTEKRKEKTSQ